ncbi:protein of unknown function DUF358 [Methanococcus maripaludis C5]|uniref:tRNA (pseudouridine(54)-N(1))-methyltransferase n=1 Tax=Methanococcus maripaludis (strain C5 / ATCC BAA-1333) TaxID=402880 RepID=TRMY_METM5|nr:tRNA (pseudouridine(54)-N(1))-methyltransferase TrmY [Methanococcus maripaludis]A4FXV7.1 RecName: Full=tRNA (pseudouridine(54)-N(1))-methyltransferase [Methanococcus maripaludis C5]ABO35041.1 protein of unknown function DUF358 [Methanococcus maripaludis C5]
MKEFIIKANKTVTNGEINLKDLPGSSGRLDLICRCVNSAFFLSHDLRRDTIFYSVLYGPPNPPIALQFVGNELKRVSPDERSIALFIKKALEKDASELWKESTSGIYSSKWEFRDIILKKKNEGKRIFYLHLNGKPLENFEFKNDEDFVFILGDHIGIGEEDEEFLEEIGAEKISLSPLELHADHCIILVHNILDKLK